jgi:hypothetical protein
MTDDELNAADGKVFSYLHRCEAADERNDQLKNWAWSVLCWDGALPLAVVCIPHLVKTVLPGRQNAILTTALVVPMIAFIVRGTHAFQQYRYGRRYIWQTGLFVLAILALALAETVFILFESMPNIAQESDWCILAVLYFGYLIAISAALFPAKRELYLRNC